MFGMHREERGERAIGIANTNSMRNGSKRKKPSRPRQPFNWWRGQAARCRARSPPSGRGSHDPMRRGSCLPVQTDEDECERGSFESTGTGQPCGCGVRERRAYLQEVHACPCDSPREGLQLDTAVVAVGRQLVRHRVVACPLDSAQYRMSASLL